MDLLTLDEVRAILRKSERTVRRYVETGDLPAYRIGGELRFKPAEVDAFIEASRVVALRPTDALAGVA